mgnify:CR=1 FL=1
MKQVIAKLKQLLEAAGLVVYLGEADPGAAYPYVVLWFSPGQPGIESAVASDTDFSDLLGVTMSHTSALNALVLSGKVRPVLDGASFTTAAGMRTTLALTLSQTVQPDRDVTLPETNRHPFYAVDRYQVVATAA